MTAHTYFRYAATALFIGAFAHIIGHIMGPEAVAFMGAPPDVVEGMRQGTGLYYAMITGIIGLLSGLGCLAWKQKKGRFTQIILGLFTLIFTLRGLVFIFFIPPVLTGNIGSNPKMFWFHFFASLFVLTIGLALGRGLWKTRHSK